MSGDGGEQIVVLFSSTLFFLISKASFQCTGIDLLEKKKQIMIKFALFTEGERWTDALAERKEVQKRNDEDKRAHKQYLHNIVYTVCFVGGKSCQRHF